VTRLAAKKSVTTTKQLEAITKSPSTAATSSITPTEATTSYEAKSSALRSSKNQGFATIVTPPNQLDPKNITYIIVSHNKINNNSSDIIFPTKIPATTPTEATTTYQAKSRAFRTTSH